MFNNSVIRILGLILIIVVGIIPCYGQGAG